MKLLIEKFLLAENDDGCGEWKENNRELDLYF